MTRSHAIPKRLSILLAGWCLLTFSTAVHAAEPETPPSPEPKPAPKLDRAALEKEFEETLSGCVMIGHFSVTTAAEAKPPAEERYTIRKVRKLKDDLWLFEVRMQYGKNDLTVPLPLRVVWADDTPMITLTDLTIPGLGTFTSRVMIFRGHYAGTWQHGEVGGHLWGRIEKQPDAAKGEDATKPDGGKPQSGKSANPADKKSSK